MDLRYEGDICSSTVQAIQTVLVRAVELDNKAVFLCNEFLALACIFFVCTFILSCSFITFFGPNPPPK